MFDYFTAGCKLALSIIQFKTVSNMLVKRESEQNGKTMTQRFVTQYDPTVVQSYYRFLLGCYPMGKIVI
jgi:hypothetical protein